MNVGSLFSGIGGLDLGLERAGMHVRWQAEIDPFCSAVLARHWPDVPNLGDVTAVDWDNDALDYGDGIARSLHVDIVAGGFPCQDVSDAGIRWRGTGIDGSRSGLWAEMFRCVRSLRPRLVLVENVPGLLVRGMGRVLGDLASIGYDAEWDCLPAAHVGAPHLRTRLFVLAYPVGLGPPTKAFDFQQPDVSHRWDPEPDVERVVDGTPNRMERDRDRALGNAVVPQVAELVGRCIMSTHSDGPRGGVMAFKGTDFEEVGWMSALVPDTPSHLDVMLYRVRGDAVPCDHSAVIPGTDQCEDCGAHLDGDELPDLVAGEKPLLGLATTRELLEELAVRFEVSTPHRHARGIVLEVLRALPQHVLAYRTVDS